MMPRKLIGYTAAAIITAPVWVPLAFATYMGYKATRFAFKYPKTTVAAWTAAGFFWYASSHHGAEWRASTRQFLAQTFTNAERRKVSELEALLQQERSEHVRTAQALREVQKHVPEGNARIPEKIRVLVDPNFYFYYVKGDDTLEKIAYGVGGSSDDAQTIAEDNGLIDSRDLVVGALLKLRKDVCRVQNPAVYEKVPLLHAVIIPGNQTISGFLQTTPDQTRHILELNAHLGLNYEDSFPYKNGARTVYYD